jgi:hypothetical protein
MPGIHFLRTQFSSFLASHPPEGLLGTPFSSFLLETGASKRVLRALFLPEKVQIKTLKYSPAD